jgi:hypothetical protein
MPIPSTHLAKALRNGVRIAIAHERVDVLRPFGHLESTV